MLGVTSLSMAAASLDPRSERLPGHSGPRAFQLLRAHGAARRRADGRRTQADAREPTWAKDVSHRAALSSPRRIVLTAPHRARLAAPCPSRRKIGRASWR